MVLTIPSSTGVAKWVSRPVLWTLLALGVNALALWFSSEGRRPSPYGQCYASRGRPMPCESKFATVATPPAALVMWSQVRSPEDSVRRLDSAWARSYAVHDTVTARALFADDMVVTGGGGQLKDKNGELADIRPAAGLEMKFFRTRDVVVRVHGGAAVVTGLAEWSFTFNGRENSPRRRYTATYVRGGSLGWRIVALHLGPAPNP